MARTRPSTASSPRPSQRHRRLDFTETESENDSEGISRTPSRSTTIAPSTAETPQSRVSIFQVSNIPQPTFKLTPTQRNFKCRITTNCKLDKQVKVIQEALRDHPDGMNWFKRSQFAHLFDVSPYIEMCLTPIWLLLCRQVITKKKHEMWFVLNGIPIRYSLMERALISGLNCSPFPSNWTNLGSDSFMKRNFKGKVTLNVVRKKLGEMVIPHPEEEQGNSRRRRCDSTRERAKSSLLEDKLKMAVLYFLCSVLMSHTKDDTQIKQSLLKIVDDLDACRTFPWGRRSYIHLMKDVQALDVESKLGKPTWACPGFILPLMLLPFECILALSPEFARLREDVTGSLPRICRWNTHPKKKKQAPSLPQILEMVSDSKDIKSILTPTLEEQEAEHMQGYAPDNDEDPDTTIDQWTTTLENGGRIFFEDIWRADVEGRRHFLQINRSSEEGEQEGVPSHNSPITRDSRPPQTSLIGDAIRPPQAILVCDATRPSRPTGFEGCESMMRELMNHIDRKVDELRSEISQVDQRVERVEGMVARFIDIHMSSAPRDDMDMDDVRVEVCGGEDGVDGDNGFCHISTHLGDEDNNSECMEEDIIAKTNQLEVQRVEGRPKRIMKKSKYKRTPFTHPGHKKIRHENDTTLEFNPMHMDKEMQKRFNEYKLVKHPTYCGLEIERQWAFFADILTPHTWLSTEHIDEAMFGIRKRQHTCPSVMKQDSVILDDVFGQLLHINSQIPEDENDLLMQYIRGKLPKLGKTWEGAKALYFPFNIKDQCGGKHWVAIKVNLKGQELVVYDCNILCTTNNEMDKYMLSFQRMIPLVLRESGYFNDVEMEAHALWSYRRPIDLQQSNTGDCGIYTIKYIEFDMQGIPFDTLSNDTMLFYREKMAIEIYNNNWVP